MWPSHQQKLTFNSIIDDLIKKDQFLRDLYLTSNPIDIEFSTDDVVYIAIDV